MELPAHPSIGVSKKHYLLLVHTRAQPKQGNKLRRRRRRRRKGSMLRDSRHSPGHSALALGLQIESLRPPISSGGGNGCRPFPAPLCGAIDGAGAARGRRNAGPALRFSCRGPSAHGRLRG
ncbi:hypothetical protein NL676_019622 [Syzygium grande]|nr:hypothetical protein NL676_019622 [Syzygium grande]